jgi:hypothetical protein
MALCTVHERPSSADTRAGVHRAPCTRSFALCPAPVTLPPSRKRTRNPPRASAPVARKCAMRVAPGADPIGTGARDRRMQPRCHTGYVSESSMSTSTCPSVQTRAKAVDVDIRRGPPCGLHRQALCAVMSRPLLSGSVRLLRLVVGG